MDASSNSKIPIPGSKMMPLEGSRVVGLADPNEHINVTVFTRTSSDLHNRLKEMYKVPPSERKYLTKEEFEKKFGASQEDLEKVIKFAHEYGLEVTYSSKAKRTIKLSGSVRSMSEAFDVKLLRYEHPKGVYIGHEGDVLVPNELKDVIKSVHGLDNHIQSEPRFRHKEIKYNKQKNRYTPVELAHLYNFPRLDGSGQCVALIALGDGFGQSDLHQYFSALGIPLPKVSLVSVDGSQDIPRDIQAYGEVEFGIEVVGAIAPKAKIVVYFAPNTEQGFINSVSTAVHDCTNNPSVISIGWGTSENKWTSQAIDELDQIFQEAAAMGITICVAAGNSGSTDGLRDGKYHVDFPASSPNVLSCGGTSLFSSNGAIDREVVWNDGRGSATGGGISEHFTRPDYQSHITIPRSLNGNNFDGRGLPDVAGNADPDTGYVVLIKGQEVVAGGTSAVANLYSGLIALINQDLGTRIGFLNPFIYKINNQDAIFNDIKYGDNSTSRGYAATIGWDACTGWGSPNGMALLKTLKEVSDYGHLPAPAPQPPPRR